MEDLLKQHRFAVRHRRRHAAARIHIHDYQDLGVIEMPRKEVRSERVLIDGDCLR